MYFLIYFVAIINSTWNKEKTQIKKLIKGDFQVNLIEDTLILLVSAFFFFKYIVIDLQQDNLFNITHCFY